MSKENENFFYHLCKTVKMPSSLPQKTSTKKWHEFVAIYKSDAQPNGMCIDIPEKKTTK